MSTSSNDYARKRFYPELEGLRGFGLIFVVIGHSYQVLRGGGIPRDFFSTVFDGRPGPIFEIGWLSVELFFVISGFLITEILLNAKGRAGYIKNYYKRRFLRIAPLYLAVIFITFYILPYFNDLFLYEPGLDRIGRYLFAIQNYYRSTFSSYPLIVTWSIAVEIHFYLVWPLLTHFFNRKWMMRVLLLFIFVMPVLKYWVESKSPGSGILYKSPIFRLDTFSYGALVSLAINSDYFNQKILRKYMLRGIYCIYPVMIGVLWLTDPFGPVYGGKSAFLNVLSFSAIGAASACLVGYFVSNDTGQTQPFFGCRFLTALGRISYSIYLTHLVVLMTVARFFLHTTYADSLSSFTKNSLCFVLMFGCCVAVGTLFYYAFERPFLRLKSKVTPSES